MDRRIRIVEGEETFNGKLTFGTNLHSNLNTHCYAPPSMILNDLLVLSSVV